MGHGNHGESLSDWKAQTVAEVVYDPGACFGTRSDFVTYHANLRTEEFYYVYGAGGTGETHRVLIRKLESGDVEAIRKNLDGDNMGERLEELRAFEEKAEGGYLLCCDYRPEELHLTSVEVARPSEMRVTRSRAVCRPTLVMG